MLEAGGGDASPNGAELFQIEADFSAEIVTFRLVGGMHPPIPPPKSATGWDESVSGDIQPYEIFFAVLKPFLTETAFYAKLAGRFSGSKTEVT